ncbi:MAG: hypothetical protein HOM34_08970 [Planctomycetes bacterium]|jgi:hypothetical protein|nr:hypothetical protein [Planctomycetota bacterium]MBT4028928.1 hypothetical protein [Planctomycetota bacterium]MBT4559878.1 hypothetical protein [Planctomycetota bacterium]MBT5101371.1 hypothetical protein [Planctomycetota bacterium]MBT5120839.1 hypothetical protein [Planctomycetota bacterium]
MNASLRYGLAVTTAPRSKFDLVNSAAEVFAAAQDRFSDILGARLAPAGETALTAILADGTRAFDFAVALSEAAWPMRLRFAIVTAPPAGAAGADEAVREKAAKALKQLKRGDTMIFDLPNRNDSELAIGTSLARLHAALLADWTDSRAMAVQLFRKTGRQAEVAERLRITQQAVSQMLLGARVRDLMAAETAMRGWLDQPTRPGLWPIRSRALAD